MRCVRRQALCQILPSPPSCIPGKRGRGRPRTRPLPAATHGGQPALTINILHAEPPKPKKLMISLDPGSSFLKTAFKVFMDNEVQEPRIGVDRNTSTRSITWPQQQPFAPMQLAYTWNEQSGEFKQHWGDDVVSCSVPSEVVLG